MPLLSLPGVGDGVTVVVGVTMGVAVGGAVVEVTESGGWVGNGLNSNPPNPSRKAAGVTFWRVAAGVAVGVETRLIASVPARPVVLIGVSKSRVVTKTEPIKSATAKTASSLRRVASERRNSVII